jgi:DNA-binding CsgD family transcriptional regulator
MHAFRLTENESRSYDRGFPGGVGLIDSIGTPEFAPKLFTTAYEMTRTQHLSAFSFRPRSSPHVLVAENIGGRAVSSTMARRYAEGYWRHDPANTVALPQGGRRSACWVICTKASEIPHTDYRSDCYTSADLEERISVSQTSDDRTIRLNFYRVRGNAFTDSEANRIFGAASILIALLRQHDRRQPPPGPSQADIFRQRLSQLSEPLSQREIDVCTCILRGITTEGIALELNISVNTVQTYRKRAYARLSISSQNELMRLVMS